MDLRSATYMSLATYRKNGDAVCTPVWFAEAGGKLYVFTQRESGKVKRLRNSVRARVAACDVRGRVFDPSGWRDAEARILSGEAEIKLAHAALRRKYGWQLLLMDVVAKCFGRNKTRAWIEVTVIGEDGGMT